jgi:methylglyoxal synthase
VTDDEAIESPPAQRRIALVAHDRRKQDLKDWARFNRGVLASTACTPPVSPAACCTTNSACPSPASALARSGGDQQIGARIADGEIDLLVFLWDPLEPQPHDHDVKALQRIAVVWNIPVACNRASADFLISSPLMNDPCPDENPAG